MYKIQSELSLKKAQREEFNWDNIANKFDEILWDRIQNKDDDILDLEEIL